MCVHICLVGCAVADVAQPDAPNAPTNVLGGDQNERLRARPAAPNAHFPDPQLLSRQQLISRWIFLCIVICGIPAYATAQLQLATIDGTVRGPDDNPVAGAVVTLLDGLGSAVSSVSTNPDGRFRLANVAPGIYSLQADAPPLRATLRTLAIGGALPIIVELRMSPTVEEQVVVRGEDFAQPGSTTTRITLSGDAIRRTPARVQSRGLQDAIATTPGWATEDNGLLHVRGVDDGFLYVIDGVPVYERLDGLFGVAPDPAMLESVNVSTGYIPPEFGFKSGGVIEVRSGQGTTDHWVGALDVAAGSEATRNISSIAGGPLGPSTALTAGIAKQSSDRFLDPVHPENFHNTGGVFSGGAQLGWNISPANTLTTVAGFGRSRFDVPHGEEQEFAGQDQRQRLDQQWQTVSWQRAWSANAISQVAGYHRMGSAALIGSPRDTPLFADAGRSLRRLGVLASVTLHRGSHLFKLGGEAARLRLREDFTFAVTDAEEASEVDLSSQVIAFTREAPFIFHDTAHPALLSLYVQDSIRPVDRVTVDFGIRADWSRQLTRASQWSPRVGVAYRWPRRQTTARASVGRFFQPPQPENLLLASSAEARELSPFSDRVGSGGAELHPERQTAVEGGLEQILAQNLRLDIAYWYRRVTNAADPNVFFGTTIIFPNTVAKGRASGFDVRLEMPRRRGWSTYLSYTNSHVKQFGPITGGLFLEADVIAIGPGTAFTPDHDQRHVGAFGVTYDSGGGAFSAALTGRYESGTPLQVDVEEFEELADRPGALLVDFERGRVNPRQVYNLGLTTRLLRTSRTDVAVGLSVLNVTATSWAYNFGNPFSGTHFGPGRTVQVRVRVALH